MPQVHPSNLDPDSLAIVGGCGHVGLPLGIVFAHAGLDVTLIDVNAQTAAQIASGVMPFFEHDGDESLRAALKTGRLHTTTDATAVAQSETVVVTIGTPVDEFMDPSVQIFDQTMDGILSRMHDGQLLILRSTVFPGVTERLAERIAARGLKIELAYCPERIAQAQALRELKKLPQIVGGVTPTATKRAGAIFSKLGVKILELSPIDSELAKLFANAYRYINFAISNQFFVVANKFGGDFTRIHEAVTTDYPRMGGFAKAGFAGGPCLLKDTMQLAAFNHNNFALGQAAMMVNEGLPSAIVEWAKQRHDLSNCTAAILGMSFKGNCDDPRASLSYKLRKILMLECKNVLCTDAYIQDPRFTSLNDALAQADIVFLGACHDEYRNLKIDKPVIDVFSFISR